MKTIKFKLLCKCGNVEEGIFFPEDKHDTLYCKCGLVWEVKRPVMDKEAEA